MVSLPQDLKIKSSSVPQHQVLETTRPSLHRRDWGLKANLPEAASTKTIQYRGIDSDIGLPDVEYKTDFATKLQMFNELGQLVTLQGACPEIPSLFQAGKRPPKSAINLSKSQKRRILAQARLRGPEYVKNLDSQSQGKAVRNIERFLKLDEGSLDGNEDDTGTSAVGLSYAQKGTLHNSPDGMTTARPTKGRFLRSSASTDGRVAVAGFVARISRQPDASFLMHKTPRDVYPFRAESRQNGEVMLSVTQKSDQSDTGRNLDKLLPS